MKTRIVKVCKICGEVTNITGVCDKPACLRRNPTYDELELRDFTQEERDLVGAMESELLRIVSDEFQRLRPSESDNFGCIEMCDHLKGKFNLDDDVYELVGMLNNLMPSMLNTKIINGQTPLYQIPYANDGMRTWRYSMVYYQANDKEPGFTYNRCTEEQVQAIKNDPKGELLNIIECVKQTKPCSRYLQFSSDYDFTLDDMKAARKAIRDKENAKIQREAAKEMQDQMIEQLTKPRVITDPNYISTARCPTCGKDSVYRISNTSRAVSVGLFGIFSKKVAKTMECRSCGYMW